MPGALMVRPHSAVLELRESAPELRLGDSSH
jgi:hypothetical protein